MASTSSQLVARANPSIRHFSGDIEMRFDIVLPGLPLLDALFADPEGGIHVHGLITGKDPSSSTDKAFGRAGSGQGGKQHLQKVPLILRARDLACQDRAGVIL